MDQLYKKVNGRYEKIGPCDGFSGFPADGLWLVRMKPGSHSHECIKPLGEVPEPYPLANLIMYRDDIVKTIMNYWEEKKVNLIEEGRTQYGAYELTNRILEDLESIILGKEEDIIKRLKNIPEEEELSEVDKQMDSINQIISNLRTRIK